MRRRPAGGWRALTLHPSRPRTRRHPARWQGSDPARGAPAASADQWPRRQCQGWIAPKAHHREWPGRAAAAARHRRRATRASARTAAPLVASGTAQVGGQGDDHGIRKTQWRRPDAQPAKETPAAPGGEDAGLGSIHREDRLLTIRAERKLASPVLPQQQVSGGGPRNHRLASTVWAAPSPCSARREVRRPPSSDQKRTCFRANVTSAPPLGANATPSTRCRPTRAEATRVPRRQSHNTRSGACARSTDARSSPSPPEKASAAIPAACAPLSRARSRSEPESHRRTDGSLPMLADATVVLSGCIASALTAASCCV
eukprot:scaffold184669_cov26-Tisochrysis_lutea.AAC.4